jgi:hypothetical protein
MQLSFIRANFTNDLSSSGASKGETADFKTSKDFKRLHETSTARTSDFLKTSKDFKRFQKTSKDFKRLQNAANTFKRLHGTSKDF